ncbi:MAG: hypothetical protein GXP25_13855 [Planctomycetes bacterium]|nr:hypothetical protein [Planctomycetota bacterium]
MDKTKVLILVAFASIVTFAGALYRYTQELDKRFKQVEQQKAQPMVNLKPIEDKLKGIETNVSALMPLKQLATEKTADSLMNLAVAGAAAKGAPPQNVRKLLGEQVQLRLAEAMKTLKKELASQKGSGPEAEKLAKDLQTLKNQVAKLGAGGGPKADQAMQRVAAVERMIRDLAKQVAAAGKGADASALKTLAQETAARISQLKSEIAAMGAKVTAAEQLAKASREPGIVILQGVLDTAKGNDIRQVLRTMDGLRKDFEKIYAVNLSTGEITVKPGYHVSYFVSPRNLIIPKSSVWRYRRVVCQVDDKGIVKCTVMFTRGRSERASDENGVVNFIVIARKVS